MKFLPQISALCLLLIAYPGLTRADENQTMESKDLIEFRLTDIMQGRMVDGIDSELVQAVTQAAKSGKFAAVLTLIEPLVQQKNPEALTTRALVNIFIGARDGILDLASESARELAHVADTYEHLIACVNAATLRSIAGDIESSKKYLHKAARITNNEPEDMYKLGLMHIGHKAFEKAKQYFREIIDTPAFCKSIFYANALSALGWIYAIPENNISEGLPYLHKAADEYHNISAYKNLGIYYEHIDDPAKAITYSEQFLKAVEENLEIADADLIKNYADAAYRLAILYANMGTMATFEKYIHIAVKHGSPHAAEALWVHYLYNNKQQEGIDQMRAIADEHNDFFANAITGIMLCETSPSEADAYLSKNDTSILSHHFKGLLLCADGKYTEAITHFEMLVKYNQYPGALFALWHIYKLMGDIERAKQYKSAFDALRTIDCFSLLQILATTPGEVAPSKYYLARMPLLVLMMGNPGSKAIDVNWHEISFNFMPAHIPLSNMFPTMRQEELAQDFMYTLLTKTSEGQWFIIGITSKMNSATIIDEFFYMSPKAELIERIFSKEAA
jgi:tetratricopeptide (TPR) repeat protein